jgi:alkylation response protein AidB-like acyl-CoA dehydrogenase
VELHDVFVPQANFVCTLQGYVDGYWQAKFIPQFAASFLGAAEAAHDFAIDYLRERGREQDPYVQHHAAEMRIGLEVMRAYLARTAELWVAGDELEAALASHVCRLLGEEHSMRVVSHAVRACGASSLLEEHPLERMLRDLQTYVRHENTDNLMASVGRAALGLDWNAKVMASGPPRSS